MDAILLGQCGPLPPAIQTGYFDLRFGADGCPPLFGGPARALAVAATKAAWDELHRRIVTGGGPGKAAEGECLFLKLAWGKTVAVRQVRNEEGTMKGFVANIEDKTKENKDFRHVLYTGRQLQLVLMSLRPGEEIGEETHDDVDQFFRVEKGKGEVWIDGVKTKIEDETAIVVPAGARHNVRNTGEKPLKLYTLYAPPEHVDGTVHATKADAQASKEHFDGRTTE